MAFENRVRVDQHFIRARLLADGETVKATLFQVPQVAEGGAAIDGWAADVAGEPVAISAAEIDADEKAVLLTIPATLPGVSVRISYDAETGSITGDDLPLVGFSDRPAANFSEYEEPSIGYLLDDDGTVATEFGYGHLPTAAPEYHAFDFVTGGTNDAGVIAINAAPFTTGVIAAATGKVGVGFLLAALDAVTDLETAMLLFQFNGALQTQFTALAKYTAGAFAYNFRSGAANATVLDETGALTPAGAKFGFLLDFDDGTVSYYLNTTLIGVASEPLQNIGWFPTLYVEDGATVGAGHSASGEIVLDAAALSTYGFPAGTKNWNQEVIP